MNKVKLNSEQFVVLGGNRSSLLNKLCALKAIQFQSARTVSSQYSTCGDKKPHAALRQGKRQVASGISFKRVPRFLHLDDLLCCPKCSLHEVR